jgi:antitoxin component YwqK of YwqJK toxin-antitoxin module
MKGYLIIILVVAFSKSFCQTGNDFEKHYESGKIQLESKFDKSCNCNRLTEYFESGKVRSKKTYSINELLNTQIDGEDIIFFENGMVQIYYFWKDGAPSGRIYCNLPSGKLVYEKFFTNKFKTGTWKFYNQDGTLKEEIVFIDNKTFWDSNDDYATNKFYFNGKLAYTVELVAGKKTNLKVINQASYDKLIASEPPTGQKLFVQNCSMCHIPNVDIVGPMLKGVTQRRINDWLTKMITNGDALQKSGTRMLLNCIESGIIPHIQILSD